jgi:hypothetical protein
MPTKRNNEVKEFAIGIKIEYNSKLYEVVEQKFCDGCSLKYICPNNDAVKNNNSDNLLSRDERIKIFGECSPIKRKDHKSVVFKEIPINISKDKYYKIAPLYREDNPSKLKSVEFDLPNGYVIDKDNSDLDKGIIRFKRNWLTIEEMYNLKPIVASEFLAPSVAVNKSTRNKIVAIITLMDIARYFNNDWYYKVNSGECGYSIAYDNSAKEPYYTVCKENPFTDVYFGNIVFKNETDAQYVIDNPNFRDILDRIFKV